MERIKEKLEQEEKKRRHEMFVMAKVTWLALATDKPRPPSSEKEAKAPPDYESAKGYNEWRDHVDDFVRKAFGPGGHPYHFETLALFATHLFEVPPSDEELRSLYERNAEEQRQAVIDRLNSMWSGPEASEPNMADGEP